ncbi:hypothetical protein AAVH_11454 [Aphelenchoides avenae]|nr:hypothetical protein AAVH_11454 [Aphelenchus avenae]
MGRTRALRRAAARSSEESKVPVREEETPPESPSGALDSNSRGRRKRKRTPSATHQDESASPSEEPKRSKMESSDGIGPGLSPSGQFALHSVQPNAMNDANGTRTTSPPPLRYSPENEEQTTPPQAVSAHRESGSAHSSDAAATIRKQLLGMMTPRTVRLSASASTKAKQATESVQLDVREEEQKALMPPTVASTDSEPNADRYHQNYAPTTDANTTSDSAEATSASEPPATKRRRPRIVFDSTPTLGDNVSRHSASPPADRDSKAAIATPESQTSSPSSDSPAQRRRPRIAFDSSFNSNKSERFSPYSTPPHSQKKRSNGGHMSSPLSISRGLVGKRFKRAPTMFTVENKAITAFFTKAYCFSNHFVCDRLEIDGVNFVCTEQYYMYWKAKIFDDSRSAGAILGTTNPKAMKKIGSGIANFDQHRWNNISVQVMAIANYRKYEQNPALRHELFSTADTLLVEASPMDQRWGIGIGLDDVERLRDQSQWRGLNILGRLLTKIRDRLLKRPEFANEVREALQQNG